MLDRQSVRTAGFTIIEVMIVLAIAGLLLMIVFMAVPALERNSRNNQRKQDVTIILSALSHYELNNSGDLPHVGSSNFLQYVQSKLTYYDGTSIQYGTVTSGIGVTAYGSAIG